MVHELIVAYGLPGSLKVVRSASASYEELRKFHSELYLDHLKHFTVVDEDYMTTAQDEELGIGMYFFLYIFLYLTITCQLLPVIWIQVSRRRYILINELILQGK